MVWKFSGNMPIYQQIVDAVRSAVLSGVYQPGEKIPSVRELATEATVNPNTMQRALQELERHGLLVTDSTNGRYVTTDARVLEAARKQSVAELAQQCIARFAALGISPEEAGQLLMQQKEG